MWPPSPSPQLVCPPPPRNPPLAHPKPLHSGASHDRKASVKTRPWGFGQGKAGSCTDRCSCDTLSVHFNLRILSFNIHVILTLASRYLTRHAHSMTVSRNGAIICYVPFTWPKPTLIWSLEICNTCYDFKASKVSRHWRFGNFVSLAVIFNINNWLFNRF